jgi:serine/threonine protein kinase
MVFAKLPFEDDNTSILYGKIKSGLYVLDKKISSELRDLLARLLCVRPKNRYNI